VNARPGCLQPAKHSAPAGGTSRSVSKTRPENVIKADQDEVRKAAIDTGKHGLVKNQPESSSA
jgi:hypothetical protein